MEQHKAAVQAMTARMCDLYERKEKFRVYHGSTNSTRKYKIDRNQMVDTSSLNHILKVDKAKKTALVEPNVPMDKLVKATLAHGLMPPVVMEFPGITVGGGYSGTSGESSSFKYGFFDSTINWIEFVLPNGEVLRISEDEHSDLFFGAAGAFGTFGVATLFEIQLIDAKAYVEVTYEPYDSASRALAATDAAAEDFITDYVDGIIFAKDRGVAITGKLTNSISSKTHIQTFSQSRDPWFYLHAEKITRKAVEPIVEAVPLQDYLFRYDRGGFWTGKYAFQYFSMPFNRVTRWALDSLMHTRPMYHALHASGLSEQYLIQDLALPASKAEQFIEYVDEELGIYPLWLCPLLPPEHKSMHPSGRPAKGQFLSDEPLMNVGVWGPGPRNHKRFVDVNRKLEQKVEELGGMKWLYAQAFYTEQQFWRNFDKEWYDNLRRKYKADHLPSIYDKVKVDLEPKRASPQARLKKKLLSTKPLTGLYGVAHLMLNKDYLLSKN